MSRRPALASVLAVVCALAVASLDGSDERRVVVAAVESEQAAALCAQSDVSLADFWARAKAMGVSAAVMRPQSLDQAMERGDILKFSRAEIERWKAAGIIEPSKMLRSDTFWIRDQRLLEQVIQAVSRQGVSVTTSSYGGFSLVRVPEDAEGLTLRGYDPERLSAASGLIPIFASTAPAITRVGLTWTAGSISGEPEAAAADLTLDAAAWSAGGSKGQLLRLAYSRPRRLILVQLEPRLGVEGNLGAIRGALRELSERGIRLAPQSAASAIGRRDGWKAVLRLLAYVLGILGPLLAARVGLLVLRRVRAFVLTALPPASPVAQIAAGLAASAAVAVLAGLLVHALAGYLDEPLGSRWAFVALVAPLVIAALTLYTIDFELWARALARPATYAALLRLAAAAMVLTLILAPRWFLRTLGIWSYLPPIAAAFPEAWWLPWRWRELFAGFPLLVQALFLINRRIECPDCAGAAAGWIDDPRGWFMFGLLGPIGVVVAAGQGGAPAALVVGQTVWTVLCGCALGAAGVLLRLRLKS